MPAHVTIHRARLQVKGIAMANRAMRRILDDIHDTAVRGARGGPYSTGELARSIYKEGPDTIGTNVYGEVGARAPYADIVERGARVHNIFPKAAPKIWRFGDRRRPQLKFVWRGRVVYTPHVPMTPGRIGLSHPGMTGKHFLLKALVKASIKYRMQLFVYDL